MQRFLFGAAAGADASHLVTACLAQTGPIPDAATLGFVYASDHLSGTFPTLLAHLRTAAPQVTWIGTLGTGLIAGAREFYDQPSLAVLVADIPREHFRPLPLLADATTPLSDETAAWAGAQGYCFGLLHGDPGCSAIPALLRDLGERLPAAFLNGGLTSSNFQNHQVVGGEVVSGGLSGVLLGPGAALVTDHTQGCLPFGASHRVTGARKNLVETLDHKRAVDVLKGEAGEPFASDPQQIGGRIFAALPIGGSDTGDYLVRNILALDMGGGGVAIGDYVEEGAQLQFCRRDPDTGREDMARMLARLRKRVGERVIRGGVYFSCLGRGRNQFGEDSTEVGLIREALGDFPLVGFFANGEIYNGRIYGYTGVLTLFL